MLSGHHCKVPGTREGTSWRLWGPFLAGVTATPGADVAQALTLLLSQESRGRAAHGRQGQALQRDSTAVGAEVSWPAQRRV